MSEAETYCMTIDEYNMRSRCLPILRVFNSISNPSLFLDKGKVFSMLELHWHQFCSSTNSLHLAFHTDLPY